MQICHFHHCTRLCWHYRHKKCICPSVQGFNLNINGLVVVEISRVMCHAISRVVPNFFCCLGKDWACVQLKLKHCMLCAQFLLKPSQLFFFFDGSIDRPTMALQFPWNTERRFLKFEKATLRNSRDHCFPCSTEVQFHCFVDFVCHKAKKMHIKNVLFQQHIILLLCRAWCISNNNKK